MGIIQKPNKELSDKLNNIFHQINKIYKEEGIKQPKEMRDKLRMNNGYVEIIIRTIRD